MNVRSLPVACVVALFLGLVAGGYCRADEPKDKPDAKAGESKAAPDVKAAEPQPSTTGTAAATPAATATPAAAQPKPKYPPFAEVVADAQPIEGLI
jgi:hypothetical protein